MDIVTFLVFYYKRFARRGAKLAQFVALLVEVHVDVFGFEKARVLLADVIKDLVFVKVAEVVGFFFI